MAGMLAALGGAMQGFGQGVVAQGERKRREQIERMKIQLADERRAQDREWEIEDRDLKREWQIEDRNYRAARAGSGGASYRAPTPDEVKKYGLDPNRTYQVNDRTGKISSFGGERDAGGGTPAGLTADEERYIDRVQAGVGDGLYGDDWPAPREELEPALRSTPMGRAIADKLYGPGGRTPPPAPSDGAPVTGLNPGRVSAPLPSGTSAPGAGDVARGRPDGVTDAQILTEARKAIEGGADPALVTQRLRAFGVPPVKWVGID